MHRFAVHITPAAHKQILAIYQHIATVYLAPDTALKYRDGIHSKIHILADHADVFAIHSRPDIQLRFGPDARVVVYKKVSIVYTIHAKDVVVRAVIPSSTIR